MPSEYIMYLSILFVGTLALAGISVTMIGMNNTLGDKSIETSLEQITQKISQSIHSLIEQGEKQIQEGATELSIQISLSLPTSIKEEEYTIEVFVYAATAIYGLKAYLIDNEDVEISISTYIYENEFTIVGSIDSTSMAPLLTFTYDGINSQIILSS